MILANANDRTTPQSAHLINPMGNRMATVSFDRPRTSAATGKRAKEHSTALGGGDILLNE